MSTNVGLLSRRSAGEQTAPGDRLLLIVGAVVAGVAAIAYIVALATHPMAALLKGFDLSVYLGGAGQALHDPGNLFNWIYEGHRGIQFTYTPFAALLFTLGRVLPFKALLGLDAVVSTFSLLAAIWIAFRELGWRPVARAGATLLIGGLAFWTEPVQRGLFLGQIELALMALIVWDMCQPDRRWWKGAAVGIAAGVDLIPLLYIAYLIITRRFRQAAVALGAFVVTVIIGFAILPRASVSWWIDGSFFQASRTGFVGSQENQSLRGILTRLVGSVNGAQAPWLLVAVVVGVLVLVAAAVLHNAGYTFAGLMVVALGTLLDSPISWDHHWVWIAPGLALIIDAGVRAARRGGDAASRGRLGGAATWWYALAGVVLVVYAAWPDVWSASAGLLQGGLISYAPTSSFEYGDNPGFPEYHWHGLQLLAGNLYIVGGIGLLLVVLVVAFRVARSHGGVAALLRARRAPVK
jgi:alpha-1,2-mannosyltransferase